MMIRLSIFVSCGVLPNRNQEPCSSGQGHLNFPLVFRGDSPHDRQLLLASLLPIWLNCCTTCKEEEANNLSMEKRKRRVPPSRLFRPEHPSSSLPMARWSWTTYQWYAFFKLSFLFSWWSRAVHDKTSSFNINYDKKKGLRHFTSFHVFRFIKVKSTSCCFSFCLERACYYCLNADGKRKRTVGHDRPLWIVWIPSNSLVGRNVSKRTCRDPILFSHKKRRHKNGRTCNSDREKTITQFFNDG